MHFGHWKQRLCFSTIFKNYIIFFSSSFLVLVDIIRFYNTSLCKSSWNINILFIILWNMPGKLYNPKYITLGSNSLLSFISFFDLYIVILLYSQIRSNLLKYLASLSLSITSSIKGSGFFILYSTVYYELDSTISPVLSYLFSYWFNASIFLTVIT